MFNPNAPAFIPNTKFGKKIKKMEDEDYEYDNESFFNRFIEIFDTINKLASPIKWYKQKWDGDYKVKGQMIIFGEMGNGKSTSGNAMAKALVRNQGGAFKKNMAFKACKSTTAVTTDIRMKYFSGLNIMDTPGFNDPKKERSDNKIMEDLVSLLQEHPDCVSAGIGSLL